MSIIKNSFDNIPLGMCIFDENGRLRLCNRRMHYIAGILLNGSAFTLDDLRSALADPPSKVTELDAEMHVYLFPDSTVMRFSEHHVTGSDGEPLTEITAADVTELAGLSIRLEEENLRIEDANRRARRLYDNMPEIIRDEETLAMKLRVHDDIGHTIMSARRALQNEESIENIRASAAQWENSINLLCHATRSSEPHDPVTYAVERADALGVRVIISGMLPTDSGARSLLALSVRECTSNCLKHAAASELYVSVSINSFSCSVTVTNNGTPPTHEIIEGGGLSGLRRRVENAGGAMSVISLPRFVLAVSLPLPCVLYPA